MACRTTFGEVELSAIYDELLLRRRAGEVIVATNSFGRNVGKPPKPGSENLFIAALDEAIAAGVHVFFSGGNNHQKAGGKPDACSPNSVWLHKSREDVFAVATCDLAEQMWWYSSRGPGQHFGDPGCNAKPDVTAPTPRNGEIVYGSELAVLPNGWGTSGACPQAAGLAALLLSLDPDLTSQALFDYIRVTARNLGFASECQGAGLIDCAAAVGRV
jgi:serine protease AprX